MQGLFLGFANRTINTPANSGPSGEVVANDWYITALIISKTRRHCCILIELNDHGISILNNLEKKQPDKLLKWKEFTKFVKLSLNLFIDLMESATALAM